MQTEISNSGGAGVRAWRVGVAFLAEEFCPQVAQGRNFSRFLFPGERDG